MSKTKAVAVRTQMAGLVKEWTRSGEPGRTFAARKGITAAKLFYWKLRLVGRDRRGGKRGHSVKSIETKIKENRVLLR